MFVFWPISSRHECKPILIDEFIEKKDKRHSPDRAGYDVRLLRYKCAQCPICDARFSIGSPELIQKTFESYSELMQK